MCLLISEREARALRGAKMERMRRTGKVVGSTMMGIRVDVSVRFRQPPARIPPGTAAAVCG